MVVALVVTLVAAGLVLFYQYRALTALESQTRVVFRQISEQTANDVVFEIRRTLDGPVFDTLLAVTHPELRAGRLDLVAEQYRDGLNEYPQVERFFLWSKETEAIAPREALFFGRRGAEAPDSITVGGGTGFTRDHDLGRTIVDIARRSMGSQVIYAAEEVEGDRQVFLRLYWTDASRVAYYAVLGFVVSPSRLPSMFNVLYERSLAALLQRRGGDLRLSLRVTDERGAVVYGTAAPQPGAATVTVPMSFYPQARIQSRLVADSMGPEVWRVEVSPPDPNTRLTQGYWPTVASVVLMLVAFGLTMLANRRAADLARMQADFIAHASHQLKTPLSLISAATETVEMEHVRTPEKLMQYLGIIRGEATRLSELVQRILEFSRLQQPPSLEFEVVDLGPLVRETVEAFERGLAGRQFTFHFEQDGPSPWVTADPAALEQVVANLLDNAVKYSADARDVRVRVASTGGEASIEVIDYGPGIPRPERSRIFEKFYRGSAASLNLNGFGLGLAIVRELVRAHRGRVEVESTPGAGSTFRVVLPAERAECVDTPRPEEAPRASEAVS
jgi:signal transduction histidine kinase